MIKRDYIYKGINGIVMTCLLFLFCALYNHMKKTESGSPETIIIFFLTALFVLGIKFLRLYIILFGLKVSLLIQFKQYCKVIPVIMLFPYKSGELFRMYCYGYHISNYIEGIIYIVFDRFVDTTALVTVMAALNFLFGVRSSALVNLLLLFIVCIFIFYYIFPSLYSFWNRYFINCTATKRKIKALFFLKNMHMAYMDIVNAIKGKFIILYILSLTAWLIELGGVLIVDRINIGERRMETMQIYLLSALTGEDSIYMNYFSIVSIIILAIMYLFVLRINKIASHKKKRKRK